MPIPDNLYSKIQEQAGYQGENRFDEILKFMIGPSGEMEIELVYGEQEEIRFFVTYFFDKFSRPTMRFLDPSIDYSNQKLIESEIIKWLLLPDNKTV